MTTHIKKTALGLATASLLSMLLFACDRYTENDLELITAYRAKTMCSCLWVMSLTEDECLRYSQQSPPVATLSIDHEHRVVEAQTVLMWGARAHFVSERFGCVLE